jgi:PAS domain S-box-containing protein
MEEHFKIEKSLPKAHSIVQDGYWEMDLSTQIVRLSDGAINIFGYEKNWHNILLSRFQNIPLPEYRALLDEALDNLLLYNEPYEAEYMIKREDDGKIRYVYSKAKLQIVPESDQVKVFGIIQDITERVSTEEELINMNSIINEPEIEKSLVADQELIPAEFFFPIKKTILVAEDNESNFKLIKYFLAKVNAEIIRAFNGKEAVEKALSMNTIDLILMDIRMPVMDGYTAAKIIRERNHLIPIIAQTAYTNDMQMAIECGCNGFITKPFDKKHLITILEKYI